MIMVATLVHLWRHFWNISCSLQATLLPLLSHFLGTAARLSTFVGRPWSPRCCDNLRTCEVRGINHISPFFDWGLGFSHVRLANATYYYLVDPSVVDCCQRTTELIQARREQTTQTIICTCYIGSAHIALALLLVLSAEPHWLLCYVYRRLADDLSVYIRVVK